MILSMVVEQRSLGKADAQNVVSKSRKKTAMLVDTFGELCNILEGHHFNHE